MRQRASTLVAGTAGLALALAGISASAGAASRPDVSGNTTAGAKVTASYSDDSGSKNWVPLAATHFDTDTGRPTDATVVVDPSTQTQHYSGIGISLDETGVSNLWKLSKAQREAAIKNLVSPTDGAGLDQFRLTIGTPDTIEHMPFTSYDEMPAGQEDWNLSHFSIKHDVQYHIIDTIKLIQKYNPQATFFASAWSAPNWMKTNDQFAGEVALKPGSTTEHYQVGKLRDDCVDVFAQYYVKFIKAYAAKGIPVQAMTVLNEPGMDVVYPAMDLSVEQQQKLILAIKKQFAKSHLDTKLWVHDFNFWDWKNPESADTKNYYRIFEDSPDGTIKGKDVEAAADGVAFHPYWGDPSVMKDTAEATGKPVYMTESGGIDGGTILDYMRLDAGSYNAWTQITDQNGGTLHWTDARDNDVDWDQVEKTSLWTDRLVTAHTDTNTVTYNGTLGGVGQFARYLDQKDVRVQSSGTYDGVKSVVYRKDTADKTGQDAMVAVLQNINATETRVKVVLGGKAFTSVLPANSFATFRWKADPPSAQGDHAPTLGALQDVNVSAGSNTSVQLRGKDKDGDTLAYYGLDVPDGVSVDARTGKVWISPTEAGTSTLTFVVTDGAKSATRMLKFTVKAVPVVAGNKVEAEAFTSQTGFTGSFVETTAGASGGKDVGYSAAGNTLDYLVDVPKAGTYQIEWRVANGSGAAATKAIAVRDVSGKDLTTVDVPDTDGWSTYQTVTTTATLAAGKQTLTVYCNAGGFNLDYWRVVADGSGSGGPTGPQGPVVKTKNGSLQGATLAVPGSHAQADTFLDVPFAKAPVGKLRWKSPQAPKSWKGVRSATAAPQSCPQGTSGDENCLYLNVYRPAGTTATDKLPVMVWAYGGGNTGGSANGIDGRRMATENNIVVVVPNYRLGALGFLDLPGKNAPAGNYGVEDLKASLQWVKKNVATFGGDRTKVTLSGQSSGGTNACRLLVDKSAAGLFQAASIDSDDCLHDVDTPKEAQARSEALASQVGCTNAANLLPCLRQKSVQELTAAGGSWNPVGATPAVDLIARGSWNQVPALLGSNETEARLFTPWYSHDADDYAGWVTDLVGEKNARKVLKKYPADTYSGTWAIQYVMADLMTDSGMRGLGGYTHLQLGGALAVRTPTYYYEFEDMNAPSSKDPTGFDYGAAHGSETQYLFPTESTWATFTAAQKTLSDDMTHYWGSFVRTHRPSAPGGAVWQPLRSESTGSFMALRPDGSQTTPIATFAKQHKTAFWSTLPTITARG